LGCTVCRNTRGVIPLLNKVGTASADLRRARRTAQMILRSDRIKAVAIGEVQEEVNPVRELHTAAEVDNGGVERDSDTPMTE